MLERYSLMLLGNRGTTKWILEKSCCNLFDVTPQFDESWYLIKYQIKHHQVFIRDETCFSSESKTCILMRPFIDKDSSWKQCSTRENMSVHNFLLFHLRRHVKKLGFVLHQVPNTCWWSKKPEFLTYYVKHSLLLRLFWALCCCILRVVILDLLTFFCWYRGTDCVQQKKQYNQTISPLHYCVDVNYESIWSPERLKSLPHWCWYVEMLLVKNKQVVSSQGLLKSFSTRI